VLNFAGCGGEEQGGGERGGGLGKVKPEKRPALLNLARRRRGRKNRGTPPGRKEPRCCCSSAAGEREGKERQVKEKENTRESLWRLFEGGGGGEPGWGKEKRCRYFWKKNGGERGKNSRGEAPATSWLGRKGAYFAVANPVFGQKLGVCVGRKGGGTFFHTPGSDRAKTKVTLRGQQVERKGNGDRPPRRKRCVWGGGEGNARITNILYETKKKGKKGGQEETCQCPHIFSRGEEGGGKLSPLQERKGKEKKKVKKVNRRSTIPPTSSTWRRGEGKRKNLQDAFNIKGKTAITFITSPPELRKGRGGKKNQALPTKGKRGKKKKKKRKQ